MGEPDDRVHRRSDFVAHVREEHGFHLGGFLGLVFGADEFLRLFLELARLRPRLAKQLLRAQIALQNVEAHGHHRQQFVDERLFKAAERAEGGHFEHAEHRVLRRHRERHCLNRGGLTKTRGNAEVIGRQIRDCDDPSLARTLANQPLTDSDRAGRARAVGKAVGGDAV